MTRAELVESLEKSGIDTPRAECAADAVLDELSSDEVARLLDRGPAGAPRDDPDQTDDAADRVRAALAECQQLGAATTEPAVPEPETTEPAATEPTATDPASADPANADPGNNASGEAPSGDDPASDPVESSSSQPG